MLMGQPSQANPQLSEIEIELLLHRLNIFELFQVAWILLLEIFLGCLLRLEIAIGVALQQEG